MKDIQIIKNKQVITVPENAIKKYIDQFPEPERDVLNNLPKEQVLEKIYDKTLFDVSRYATLDDITPSLRNIAEMCGMEVALRFFNVFAGGEYYIPQESDKGPILDLIGKEYADKLRKAYCGERIDIPTRFYSDKGVTNIIARLDAEGYPQIVIANIVGCSKRLVRAVIWRKVPQGMHLITHKKPVFA